MFEKSLQDTESNLSFSDENTVTWGANLRAVKTVRRD